MNTKKDISRHAEGVIEKVVSLVLISTLNLTKIDPIREFQTRTAHAMYNIDASKISVLRLSYVPLVLVINSAGMNL
jgi:hypothetical protein